jgi:hypothetical protein
MKKLGMTTIAASVLLLSACGGSSNKEPLSVFKGVWEREGTGQLWAFDDEKLTTYSFNNFGCIKDEENNLSDVEDLIKYLSINDDKTQFTFDTLATSNRHFTAMADLPENCKAGNLLTQTDLPTNFEFLWHTMNDYYAFFELRDVDWQGVYDKYRPQITASTTDDEFFDMMEEIFSEFGDGHLSLDDGKDLSASGDIINGFILEVLRNFDGEGDVGNAYHALKAHNEQVLAGLLQDDQLHSYQDSDAIRWGKVSGNIGYIRIDRVENMNAEGEQEYPDNILDQLTLIKQDLVDTDTVMQAALSGLGNSEALIIDLRFNEWGYDNISLKIAS